MRTPRHRPTLPSQQTMPHSVLRHPLRCLAALAALALLAFVPAQAARQALVIGNSAYADSPLKNPVNDARAMDAKLRSLGFEVQKVENLKRALIGRTLSGFAARIRPGDEVVVFYAGHGLQVKGVNYLPTVDAEIHGEDDVAVNSLNLNALLDRLDEAKAGVKLLFLDACRNNPYARSFRSASRGLARVADAPSGTLMHFATRPGSVAADGNGANGLYTTELLKAIDQPGLPVEQMLKRVAAAVERASQGQQEPWVEGSLKGDFYFRVAGAAPNPVATVLPEPVAPPPAPAGPVFALDDLKRQADQQTQQQAEQARQQAALLARMRANLEQVQAFAGPPALKVQAWQRFLSAWTVDQAPGDEGQALRQQAEQQLAQAQAAARPVAAGGGDKACAECPTTVLLPAGSFQMGSATGDALFIDREGPLHGVRIGQRLAVAKYAVTRAEFAAFVNASGYRSEAEQGVGCYGWTGSKFEKSTRFNWRQPGFEQGDDYPVVCVSWNDAQKYIDWLNSRSPVKGWRLLSEAEWEYAARAGSSTRYNWGDDIGSGRANCNGCGSRWDNKSTSPVASFPANAFGLHDMHGNVWQWVQDAWHDNYSGAPSDGSAWLSGGDLSERVLRGGSWNINPRGVRSAFRGRSTPDDRSSLIGFRLARTVS